MDLIVLFSDRIFDREESFQWDLSDVSVHGTGCCHLLVSGPRFVWTVLPRTHV